MKNFAIIFVLFAISISPVATFAQEQNKSATEIVDTASSKVPNFILKPIKNFYKTLETFRTDLHIKISTKRDAIRTEISNDQKNIDKEIQVQENADPETYQKKTYVDSKYGNALHRALLHIYIFFYNIFIWVLSSVYTFYSSIIIVLFLILRFIWNHVL